MEIAKTIREELEKLGAKHLVAGAPAHAIKPVVRQPYDDAMTNGVFDVVNFHSHPDNYLGGKRYDLGGFMTKDLFLATLGEFCAGLRDVSAKKPLPFVLDEDNVASAHKDEEAWTVERKRAWVTVMNQSHYDFIDFSITVGNETGTPESNRKIRTWMKHVSEFVHSVDVVKAKPRADWVNGLPAHVFQSSLVVEGEDYAAYLADARERTDENVGKPVSGTISMALPAGTYVARFYSPIGGVYSPGVSVVANEGKAVELELPEYTHDLVLRVTRKK